MDQKQVIEKITHLSQQLQSVHSLQLNLRNSNAVAAFYRQRISHYKSMIFTKQEIFNQPIAS